MECIYCNKLFSTKHSLASHKTRYHRDEFKSACLKNKWLIKDLMRRVLQGEFVLKKYEKDRLKIVRDGIRKIVYENKDLEDFLDKEMESAIKLILKICKITFPDCKKRISSNDVSDEKGSSSDEPNDEQKKDSLSESSESSE